MRTLVTEYINMILVRECCFGTHRMWLRKTIKECNKETTDPKLRIVPYPSGIGRERAGVRIRVTKKASKVPINFFYS